MVYVYIRLFPVVPLEAEYHLSAVLITAGAGLEEQFRVIIAATVSGEGEVGVIAGR